MTFFHDTTANINFLAAVMPLPRVVAHGWLRAEGQSIDNPTNPLNILYYGTRAQVGHVGRFARYATPAAGLADAARLVHGLTYYAGVRRAIAAWRAQPLNRTLIVAVARAIEASPWAAGHYGGGPGRNGTIVRYVLANIGTTPAPQLPPHTGDAYISLVSPVWSFTPSLHTIGAIHGGGTIVPVGPFVVHLGLHYWPIVGGQFTGGYLHSGDHFVVTPI